jgi:ABC-type transport system involved in multi-copper enzyme maturation permease subunit
MIMIILSKPIKKHEYMLGKYFGVLALCVGLFIAIELVIYGAHLFKTGEYYGFTLMLRQLYLILALIPWSP